MKPHEITFYKRNILRKYHPHGHRTSKPCRFLKSPPQNTSRTFEKTKFDIFCPSTRSHGHRTSKPCRFLKSPPKNTSKTVETTNFDIFDIFCRLHGHTVIARQNHVDFWNPRPKIRLNGRNKKFDTFERWRRRRGDVTLRPTMPIFELVRTFKIRNTMAKTAYRNSNPFNS